MQATLGLLYAVFFLLYIFSALFVVYHIAYYSLSRRNAFFGIVLFLVVASILLFTNALLFFTLPFDELLPPNPNKFG